MCRSKPIHFTLFFPSLFRGHYLSLCTNLILQNSLPLIKKGYRMDNNNDDDMETSNTRFL